MKFQAVSFSTAECYGTASGHHTLAKDSSVIGQSFVEGRKSTWINSVPFSTEETGVAGGKQKRRGMYKTKTERVEDHKLKSEYENSDIERVGGRCGRRDRSIVTYIKIPISRLRITPIVNISCKLNAANGLTPCPPPPQPPSWIEAFILASKLLSRIFSIENLKLADVSPSSYKIV